jgi:hypothetical protein
MLDGLYRAVYNEPVPLAGSVNVSGRGG